MFALTPALAAGSVLHSLRFCLTVGMVSLGLQFGLCQTSHGQLVDAIRGWFRDPLVHAIDKGLKPGGDLAWELEQLDEFSIETQAHGEAVLRAVASLPQLHGQNTEAYSSVDSSVASLFLQVYDSDSPAYVLLWRQGVPALLQHYQALRRDYDQRLRDDGIPTDQQLEELLDLLIVFATYQTREGTDCVVEAARSGLGSNNYQWYAILEPYSPGHPHAERLFAELGQQLPADNIAENLLDVANAWADEEQDFAHPFATPAGLIRLKKWLSSADEMDSGKAYSAAAALAYIDLPGREVLLDIAAAHRDPMVRIEAAVAAESAGLPIGLERLSEYCMDVHMSSLAQQRLEELEHSDLIPAAALEPKFAAMAQFSNWLQYESELARPPEELEVLDQRELYWLDSDERLRMSVIRYRAAGQTPLDEEELGVGLVGSMTWVLLGEAVEQLPIEDIYSVHCTYEAICHSYIVELDARERFASKTRLASLQQQWTGQPLEQVEVVECYRIDSTNVKYPQDIVAVATAQQAGEPGWVVFDGPRSRWYPQQQFPDETPARTILRLHVGRQLLDFPPVDTRQLRAVHRSAIAPEVVVSQYEQWLGGLSSDSAERRVALLESYGDLNRHFDKYVEAKAQLTNQTADAVYVATYDILLAPAQQGDVAQRMETLDVFALAGQKFEGYVQRIAAQDPQRVADLIELFEPYWVHNFGRNSLAKAAWQAGLQDEARRILEPHANATEQNFFYAEDARILAQIWHAQGRVEEARGLLAKAIERAQSELSEYEGYEEPEYSQYTAELRENLLQTQTLSKRLFEADSP